MKKIFIGITLVFLSFALISQNRVYKPAPVAPDSAEAEDIFPELIIDWTAVTGTGTISYELLLDTDPEFSTTIPITTELSAYQAKNLSFGDTYYWKVRAHDDNNTSDWTNVWNFTVINTVYLKKPSNDPNPDLDDYEDPETKIQWDEIEGVTHYEVQYDTNFYWEPFKSGTEEDLFGVYTLNENNAWLVGSSGLVKHFDGQYWMEDESLGASEDLYAVAFANDTVGWIAGESGAIYKYMSGTWTQIEIDEQGVPFEDNIYTFYVFNENTAIAGCEDGKIAWLDAGQWMITDTLDGDIMDLDFTDVNNGWAVCEGGKIFHFDGTAWAESFDSGEDMFGISFTDANNGWAGGASETILHYDGSDWTTYFNEELDGSCLAVLMLDEEMGFIFGDEENVYTYGNENWTFNTSGVEPPIVDAHIMNGTGWAVGEEGALLHYGSGAFNSPFSTMISYPATRTDTFFYELPFGAKIYWRMRAKHDEATSAWSSTWTFRTLDSLKQKTPNGSTDEDLRVKFTWSKIDGVTGYKIQVDNNMTFSSPVTFVSDSASGKASLKYFGTKYYWRSRIFHSQDTSRWSTIPFEFTTTDQVELSSPENGEEQVGLLPILEWDGINGVEYYKIQYNTEPDFSNPCCNEISMNPNSFQVNFSLEQNQDYYWRIKAYTSKDSSEWSEVWHFKTLAVGLNDEIADKLNIYPNPTDKDFNIRFNINNASSCKVLVMDMLGQTFFEKEIKFENGVHKETINTMNYSNGIYLIRIEMNNDVYTEKLIIDK